jgi:transposase
LIIAVVVLAASVHENTIGITLLGRVAARTPTLTKALIDQGFKTKVVEHGRDLGIDVEIVQRNPDHTGFVPQPIRWRVEQTPGTLMLHRRLVRDYEINPATSEARVYWAISDVMARRLTGTSTPTWRGA